MKINGDCCDDGMLNLPSLYVQMCDVDKKNQAENMAASVLDLYKQCKLQMVLEKTPYLDEHARKNLMYTNARFIDDITEKIEHNGIDYPKTFSNLTNDQNTNTILNAIQNRKVHLNTDPYGPKKV